MVRRWGGVVVAAVLSVTFIGTARAQEQQAGQGLSVVQDQSSRDQELETIKKRLEALEKEKAERDAAKGQDPAQPKDDAAPQAPAGDANLMDPADDKNWFDRVKVGGGIRSEFRSVKDMAPNGHDYSQHFAQDNARLYVSAKVNEWISATLDTEFMATPAILDAIAQFKVSDAFNVYTGRLLPATDRSNFDGPFYISAWDFPFLSDSFNAATGRTGDRDDGLTVWGDVNNFKYWGGVYEGHQQAAGAPVSGHLMWAGRVQYDFFDDEKGYYLQSTYYGQKRLLAIGLAANFQQAAITPPGGRPISMGDLCVDVIWEEAMPALGGGVPTVEVAYYYFGRHGFSNSAAPIAPDFDTGAGVGALVSFAYLIPNQIGWGKFQPFIRYQGFDDNVSRNARNPASTNDRRIDVGVNYIMVGHNARISVVYTHEDFGAGAVPAYTANEFGTNNPRPQTGMFVVGTQVQF